MQNKEDRICSIERTRLLFSLHFIRLNTGHRSVISYSSRFTTCKDNICRQLLTLRHKRGKKNADRNSTHIKDFKLITVRIVTTEECEIIFKPFHSPSWLFNALLKNIKYIKYNVVYLNTNPNHTISLLLNCLAEEGYMLISSKCYPWSYDNCFATVFYKLTQ